jgi:peroxiredoxin
LKLHEIAADGLPTGGIRATEELELFPGYRSDVLVQIPDDASGEFYLVDRNAATGTGADGSPEPLKWIARLKVVGPAVKMNLPTAGALLPHRLPMLTDSADLNTRYAFYGITNAGFFISRVNIPVNGVPTGSEFDPNSIRTLFLNQTERWEVGSRNEGLNVTHPFHIHVNPFLVTKVLNASSQDVTAAEFGGPIWRDTLAMKQGFTYTLLTKYTDFTGDFVSHCHILDHEDTGMMERMRIANGVASLPGLPFSGAVSVAAARGTVNEVINTIPSPAGKASVLLFVRGPFCSHCLAQLTEMAGRIPTDRADVFVVSQSTEEELSNFPALPFHLVADPELLLTKRYGAYEQTPKHATIVRDGAGRELLRYVGEQPFMDLAAILRALNSGIPAPLATNTGW